MSSQQKSLVNGQILDSVADTNGFLIGSGPAQSNSILDAVMAETLGMSMHNAVTTQHNMQMVTGAAVAATCARMLKGASTVEVVLPKVHDPLDGNADLAGRVARDGNAAERSITGLQRTEAAAAAAGAAAAERLRELGESAGEGANAGED